MGCCISTTADRKNNNAGDSSVSEKDRAPPPPMAVAATTTVLEEETVKEVLSETTTLSISSKDNRVEKTTTHNPVMAKIKEEEAKPKIPDAHPKEPGAPTLNPPDPFYSINKTEDESEVSDICSLSVSESVSTITINESKKEDTYEEEEEEEDDEDEVRQKRFQPMRHRSPAKSMNRVVGNHQQTRRVDRSPGKKHVGAGFGSGSVRLVHPDRDSGTGIGSRSSTGTRDPAERFSRRSRSPATNRSVVASPTQNSDAKRKNNNQSPGRARLMESNQNPNNSKSEQKNKWASCSATAGNYNGATNNESFENPLVSLECFIFL